MSPLLRTSRQDIARVCLFSINRLAAIRNATQGMYLVEPDQDSSSRQWQMLELYGGRDTVMYLQVSSSLIKIFQR